MENQSGRDFEKWIAEHLKQAVEEIQPRDVLPEIWGAIHREHSESVTKNGGTMADNEYSVTITEREDSPEDWPIKSIHLEIIADDEEQAEDIADKIITLIQQDRKVVHAMVIDEVYES